VRAISHAYSRKIPANLTSSRLKGSALEPQKASRGRGIGRENEIVLLMKQTPIPSSSKEMWDVANHCAGSLGLPQPGAG